MYLIKRIFCTISDKTPLSFDRNSHGSEVIKIDWYSAGIYRYFANATIFKTKIAAEEQRSREHVTYLNYWNELVEAYQKNKNIHWMEGSIRRRDSMSFEVIDINDIPVEGDFYAAFPFDENHIPEHDRDVEFIDRLGKVTGVVTNFLRKETLVGNFLNKHPAIERWRYIEDSVYLKLKK